MSNSSIVNNIIYPIKSLLTDNPTFYIIIDEISSIFDKVIALCDHIAIIPQKGASEYISYNIYWSSNPTNHVSNLGVAQHKHIQDIIYFRDAANQHVKKEDKFLIQNKLSRSNKIVRNPTIQSSWHMKGHVNILEYGVPNITINDNQSRKSLLFINLSQNKTIDLIYQDIKRFIPDTDILNNIKDMSYIDIARQLQEYKVCVEMEDSYNILAAVASGCRVLSNKKIDHCESVLLDSISNIEALLHLIKAELSNYGQYDYKQAAEKVISSYNFEIFENQLYQYLLDFLRKPFLL